MFLPDVFRFIGRAIVGKSIVWIVVQWIGGTIVLTKIGLVVIQHMRTDVRKGVRYETMDGIGSAVVRFPIESVTCFCAAFAPVPFVSTGG